jgi:superfamily II DNA or RNA helicase
LQTLRDYQADGYARILDAFRGGATRVIAVAPTGSGKTTIFTHWCAQLAAQSQRSLILVPRRELAYQAANRLREFGVPFGYIMAGEQRRATICQVASYQSLSRRTFPPANLVIVDEAHLSTAPTQLAIIRHYVDQGVPVAGFTATPWRLGGTPLSGLYDGLVVIDEPRRLRELGHLCKYVGFSYKHPNLAEIKTVAGEYDDRSSATAMSKSLIVDNIVEEWGKHARGLSTVVFAVTIDHSKHLTDRFLASGVRAEHLDAKTTHEQRKAILRRVEDGTTQVLCNVGIAIEGIDIPRLKCCVLARPTKSLVKALQMTGRVMRPWQGVTARIHDHAFIVNEHGLPDDVRDYSLVEREFPGAPEALESLRTCKVCFAIYRGDSCPLCGERRSATAAELKTIEDAEQIAFSSDEQLPPKPIELLPIQVRWNTPGRVYEGVLGRAFDLRQDWGMQRYYELHATHRVYHLPGTVELTQKLNRVTTPDSQVRITYTHDEPLPGGRTKKKFTVQVNR